MKFVHVFTGAEVERDEADALHWPWVTPDRVEVRDRIARARTSAREEVAARIARPTATQRAAAKVRRSRATAARAAERATSSTSTEEGSSDA